MNAKLNSELPQGSLIAYMSGLVKQYGGINLAQGLPGFAPPSELLDELSNIVHDDFHQYPQGNGDPELIEVIKIIYKPVTDISSDQLLVVQGATEGISLVYTYLIKQFGTNWSTLAFDPVYESYKELPGIFGNDLIRLPMGQGGEIDWERVVQTVNGKNVKLIFVNSPGNPLGKVWSQNEIDRLMLLSERHDFYILFDGVYKDLFFTDNQPFIPLSNNLNRLFYVNSFSKMLSITGWRVGYLISSNSHIEAIRQIHDYTGLCASSLLQKAIARYMTKFDLANDYLKGLRARLQQSNYFMLRELNQLGFSCAPADGGYFIWTKLPAGYKNGFEFAISLYESSKIALVPGSHFSETAGSYIRINIAREINDLIEAVSSIKAFINH